MTWKLILIEAIDPSLDSYTKIAKQGFVICNTDGKEGLTWSEVKVCEVFDHNITF